MRNFRVVYTPKGSECSNSEALTLTGLIRTVPLNPAPGASHKPTTKIYATQLPGKKISVMAYKQWLLQELQKLAGASDNDEIEISN